MCYILLCYSGDDATWEKKFYDKCIEPETGHQHIMGFSHTHTEHAVMAGLDSRAILPCHLW